MRSFQASKHTFFLNLLLLFPAALEVLFLGGNFFASLFLHDNFILRQSRIFHVNDTETWSRLSTVFIF